MVRAVPPKIYWDSNCFIAYLVGEPGRIEACAAIIRMAEQGELDLYTSYMAIVETVRIPSDVHLDVDDQIRRFFDERHIRKVTLDDEVAHEARRLQRVTSLRARDAVHLATALTIEAEALHTYDADLLRLDCGSLGLPIRIEQPS